MTAPARLHLGDRETALDLASFLRRARQVNDDGVRLTVAPYPRGHAAASEGAGRLDLCAPVLTRSGLLDAGLEILAVRSWAVSSADLIDAVFETGSLLDRLERGEGIEWPVPPVEIHRAWAGQALPRAGWQPAGSISAAALAAADRRGSEEIAGSLPADPGQAMVNQARRAVWGAGDPALGGLPAGVGFTALRMGFLGDPAHAPKTVAVRQRQGHILVSMPYGSVVVRIPGFEVLDRA